MKKLKWTTKLPTKPGYYLVKQECKHPQVWDMILRKDDWDPDGPEELWINSADSETALSSYLEYVKHTLKWYGPIEKPK